MSRIIFSDAPVVCAPLFDSANRVTVGDFVAKKNIEDNEALRCVLQRFHSADFHLWMTVTIDHLVYSVRGSCNGQ